jgi:hypothetical protein
MAAVPIGTSSEFVDLRDIVHVSGARNQSVFIALGIRI